MKAFHALLTLIVGTGLGVLWLRAFWRDPSRVRVAILAAPIGFALLGLGHWVAYDFSLRHWAGDFSLAQALFNTAVATALLLRRGSTPQMNAENQVSRR